MDIYTIWADKEDSITDLEFVNNMKDFLQHLVDEGKMESYRITRCKMGFRSIADMPEFMILMEFTDMGQMDSAFKRVAPLEGELEQKHNFGACLACQRYACPRTRRKLWFQTRLIWF
jgi:hypothetical protein